MINFKKVICTFGSIAITSLAVNIESVIAGYSGNLEVKFNGINSSKGQICLNLFNGQTGFPDGGKGAALKVAKCTPIVKGTAKFTFANLPYGNYAISAVHDTNGDTRMNSNFFGIPTEGIGFSNNATVVNSAPSFADSQFFMSGSKTELSIKMQYF
jgi:uncharacterized protein (DUF2141 family)